MRSCGRLLSKVRSTREYGKAQLTDHSEANLRQAMEVAADQSARLSGLRSATSLGRLLRDQSRRDKAHDVVASRYGWFADGFEIPDLLDAKALFTFDVGRGHRWPRR